MSVPPLGYGFHLTNTPLPPLQEVLENLFTVEIPMTVTFRGVNSRQSALIRGPHGWGEFAPFLEYGAQESAAWLACPGAGAYAYPVERDPACGTCGACAGGARQVRG